jgi:hypothetical protein
MTNLEIDLHIDDAARTTINLLATTTLLSVTEVNGSEGMDGLLDARTTERDLFVVGVTEGYKCIVVVSTAVRFQVELPTGTEDVLDFFSRVLIVALCTIMNLEWRCSMQGHGDRDASITRATRYQQQFDLTTL